MIALHPKYIEDTAGHKLVMLPRAEFDSILKELEELEDIHVYNEVWNANGPIVSMDIAVEMIRKVRKGL